MKINDNGSDGSIKTSNESTQGHPYKLGSRTQVLTEQKQTTTTAATASTKRKQPRNRRLQRYWRKLRRQNIDETTIQKYKKRINRQRQQQQQQEQEQIQNVEMEEIFPLNDTMGTNNELVHQQVCYFHYNNYHFFLFIFVDITRSI